MIKKINQNPKILIKNDLVYIEYYNKIIIDSINLNMPEEINNTRHP